MAANDLDNIDIKPIEGMITCCICTEVYTDPIVLPCRHTFCKKCFQSSEIKLKTGQGDKTHCPICRRMFKIPPEESNGSPHNFFTESLIQVENVTGQSASSTPVCDTCSEANEDPDNKVPAADTYCVDCHQKFCPTCSRHHRRFTLAKNHCLLPINDYASGQSVVIDPSQGICELHKLHVLDIYCTDCKTVVCAMCFIDNHGNHKGCHVNKVVAGFRKEIESNFEAITECGSKAETKKEELLKVKDVLQERVTNLECEVSTRKDELKEFLDEHATSLLQGVHSIRQSKLQEIQMATDDIDAYLASLDTYNSNYQKIIGKGSARDICCAFSDLSDRAVELQQQYQQMIVREIPSFSLYFQKSDVGAFLEENCDNLIGGIEEDGDQKSTHKVNQSLLSEQSNEIERLRQEIKCEIANRESLRLVIVQLRIKMHKEAQASHKVFTEELSNEKAYNEAHMLKLRETLDNNKIACSTLQAEIKQLEQTNKSLLDENDKLRQELEKGKTTNNSVEANDNRLVQEVNDTLETTISSFDGDIKKLQQEPETKENVEVSYKSDPILIRTFGTKATNAGKNSISGLTILDKELFVTRERISEVEVYDLMSFTLTRRWHLKELVYSMAIASCHINKCIYIFDKTSSRKPKQIFRVDGNGNFIKKWSTGRESGWDLSVTYESNIILTLRVCNGACFNEYSPDGKLIRQIRLPEDLGLRVPWHAIKLTTGNFVVSLGDLYSVLCIVNGDGKILKSVGSGLGMKRPVHLSVDENGFVMVADQLNSRVLLFDSDLQFKREILSKGKHGLQQPWRILLDESNDRLLVAVTDGKPDNGRIFAFDLK